MLIAFLAARVVDKKFAFSDLPNGATNIVPQSLEDQVARQLIDTGDADLVPVRLGGTAVAA